MDLEEMELEEMELEEMELEEELEEPEEELEDIFEAKGPRSLIILYCVELRDGYAALRSGRRLNRLASDLLVCLQLPLNTTGQVPRAPGWREQVRDSGHLTFVLLLFHPEQTYFQLWVVSHPRVRAGPEGGRE